MNKENMRPFLNKLAEARFEYIDGVDKEDTDLMRYGYVVGAMAGFSEAITLIEILTEADKSLVDQELTKETITEAYTQVRAKVEDLKKTLFGTKTEVM